MHQLTWTEDDQVRTAVWHSENGAKPPENVIVVDDSLTADAAFRNATTGVAMLWRGDFNNGRQLLSALGRRLTPKKTTTPGSPTEAFYQHRQRQSHRARMLSMLLVPIDIGNVVPLRRAPDVRQALDDVYGPATQPAVTSLRELLGVIGAREWRIKGVPIRALGEKIYPHYGVFSPVRGEYIDLVDAMPLPRTDLAFDIGTGSGVLAALLARRGVEHVVATEQDSRAIACARENLQRLGYGDTVEVMQTDLFPPGRAPLVMCNPPWIPARPTSPLEHAVYDPGSRMLKGFLSRLGKHLTPGGEAWLILSDLAEHLGLATRQDLLADFAKFDLVVLGRTETAPTHSKASDIGDPLAWARTKEVTSLWRLAKRPPPSMTS